MRYVTIAAVLLATASLSSAQISFSIEHPDNTGQLTGYVTNGFVLNTSSDWLTSIIVVTPNSPGKIYQDASGSNGPPSSTDIATAPTLEWDTFISTGLAIDGSMPSVLSSVDPLYGGMANIFDEDAITLEYYSSATNNIGELLLARVTLMDDAEGTWRYIAWTIDGGPEVPVVDISGTFNNGTIPEPTSLMILSVGLLPFFNRKRRSTQAAQA